MMQVTLEEQTFKLRVLTMEHVIQSTPILSLPVVTTGTLSDLESWAAANRLELRCDASLFGGYFANPATGDCYFVT